MKNLAVFDLDNTLLLEKGSKPIFASLFPEESIPQHLLREMPLDEWTHLLIDEYNKCGPTNKKELIERIGNGGRLTIGMDKVIKKLSQDHEIIIITCTHRFIPESFLKTKKLLPYISKIYGQASDIGDDGEIIRDKLPESWQNCSRCSSRMFCKTNVTFE